MNTRSDFISIAVINGLTLILNSYLILKIPQIVEFTNNSFDGTWLYILYLLSLVISILLFRAKKSFLKWVEVICLLIVLLIGILITGRMMLGLWGVAYSGLKLASFEYFIPVLIGVLSVLNVVFLFQVLFGRKEKTEP